MTHDNRVIPFLGKSMYFNKDRIYVQGAHCAAVYDLENRVVYEINHDGKLILDHIFNQDGYSFSDSELEYLQSLLNMGILASQETEHTQYITHPENLKYVWLELTDACNLRCVHCYGDFGYCVTKHEDAMKTTEWKKVIESIAKFKNVGIQFIGGEPLAYPDFPQLLSYAHECGISRIDIFTNATLLTDDIIELIRKCNASVRISIYGHNSEVHDKITGKKGSFEKLSANLAKLSSFNIKVKLALIVMKENEIYFDDIVKYLKKLPAGYNGYDVIRNTAPGKKNEHYIFNPALLKPRYQSEASFFTSFEEFYHNHYYNSCWSGKLSVTANGDVIPCIFARQSVCGNVKQQSIDEILKGLNSEWTITKDSVEVCRDCEYRYACHDCRPTAYGVTGNYFSKHERCTYDPYTGEWRSVEDYTRELNEEIKNETTI